MNNETVWSFWTDRFEVRLVLTRDYNYQYDGDDEQGVIQLGLNQGTLVAFDSAVEVVKKGKVIGADYLGGSVYHCDNCTDFWKAHRGTNPNDRNCSISNRNIGHYFPDMVKQAIEQARLNPDFD